MAVALMRSSENKVASRKAIASAGDTAAHNTSKTENRIRNEPRDPGERIRMIGLAPDSGLLELNDYPGLSALTNTPDFSTKWLP